MTIAADTLGAVVAEQRDDAAITADRERTFRRLLAKLVAQQVHHRFTLAEQLHEHTMQRAVGDREIRLLDRLRPDLVQGHLHRFPAGIHFRRGGGDENLRA